LNKNTLAALQHKRATLKSKSNKTGLGNKNRQLKEATIDRSATSKELFFVTILLLKLSE
jgi:hypothetical protein